MDLELWRIAVATACVSLAYFTSRATINSLLLFLSTRLGRKLRIISDIKQFLLTYLSWMCSLLWLFGAVYVLELGTKGIIIKTLQYLFALPLVLGTFALRKVATNFAIRYFEWNRQSKEYDARIMVVTETIGFICFILVVVELFYIFFSSNALASFLVVDLFLSLEILSILAGFTTLKNTATGVFLIFSEPFRTGCICYVRGTSGVIEKISLARTVMRKFDGSLLFIPNGVFADDSQTNGGQMHPQSYRALVRLSSKTCMDSIRNLLQELPIHLSPCAVSRESANILTESNPGLPLSFHYLGDILDGKRDKKSTDMFSPKALHVTLKSMYLIEIFIVMDSTLFGSLESAKTEVNLRVIDCMHQLKVIPRSVKNTRSMTQKMKCCSSDDPNKVRVGETYWKKSGEFNWILGHISAYDAETDTATFFPLDESSGEVAVLEPQLIPLKTNILYQANPLFSTASDMTSLRHLHEAALTKNLEDRSSPQNQRPYTFMSNVLIALNPLKYLEGPDKSIFIDQSLDRCPPHPFYVAESAYRQLCAVRAVMQNQSIIISGESGSGKTETSKIILEFLITRALRSNRSCPYSEDEDEPEVTASLAPISSTTALSYPTSNLGAKLSSLELGQRLMETIPILESFGNSKTHRNHNSSRFGKYMRLQFSTSSHELVGASIDTYLLEKSRLVQQPKGERNFHIFYELLHSKQEDYLVNELRLLPKEPTHYFYLNQSGCISSESIDDGIGFSTLCKALQFVGITENMQHELFRLVAGLLHLGNVNFREIETSEGWVACVGDDDISSQKALCNCAELLGVSRSEIEECILLKRIITRGSRKGSIYYLKRDNRNACYSRDTIAKTVYEHLFGWVMIQCSSALDFDALRSDVMPYIGVLDIFGFENFEPNNRNSFEQLLINYANEALQSLFNSCVLEAEQVLYRSEHIYAPTNHDLLFPYPISNPDSFSGLSVADKQKSCKMGLIQYSDNTECLNLIASRHGGIFVTIDNVSRLPSPSDRKLNERLHTLFKRHPCFPRPHPKDLHDTFLIRHYAGTVSYHIQSFVDKNNNIISEQFEELIKNSKSRILQETTGRSRTRSETNHFNPNGKQSTFSNAKRVKGGSVSNLFSSQMKGLISELEGTNCNFVRCIKPNQLMTPGYIDRSFVVEQLRCSGTVQACEVLRVGLPTRILYAEVVDTYKSFLSIEILQMFDNNEKLFTQAILWAYSFPSTAYRLGDTRLFFKTGKIDLLDQLLTPSTYVNPEDLSKLMLKYLRKRKWINGATKAIAFQKFHSIYSYCKFRRRATIIQCMIRQALARKKVGKLRRLHRTHALWTKLAHKSTVMSAFQELPQDKMILLDRLLRARYIPQRQMWLLKWLGPLQRVIYLQKLWKRLISQFSAKQGFLRLYHFVKEKRSAFILQNHVRIFLARIKFQQLRKAKIARMRWRHTYIKVKVFNTLQKQFVRIHVLRLENDNNLLSVEIEDSKRKLQKLQMNLAELTTQYQDTKTLLHGSNLEVIAQSRRIASLEHMLEIAQVELLELKHSTSHGFIERAIRFFTCSSSTNQISTSPKSDEQQKKHKDTEDTEIKIKEDDMLWTVSRFCF